MSSSVVADLAAKAYTDEQTADANAAAAAIAALQASALTALGVILSTAPGKVLDTSSLTVRDTDMPHSLVVVSDDTVWLAVSMEDTTTPAVWVVKLVDAAWQRGHTVGSLAELGAILAGVL